MPIRRRIELSVAETRLRFQQLVRLTGLTGQVTVVVDGGRPVAAIVPARDVLEPPPDPPRPAPDVSRTAPASPRPASDVPRPMPDVPRQASDVSRTAPDVSRPASDAGAGWLRRIEKVREDVRRQHAGRIRELSQALEEAWQLLDQLHPPGTDRHADALRAAHADLRAAHADVRGADLRGAHADPRGGR